MFHPDTQFAIDLWTCLAADARGGVPSRAALRPEAFGRRLSRLMLIHGAGDAATFRLVGGAVEGLHGRPMVGLPANRLWTSQTAALFTEARSRGLGDGRPMVLSTRSDRDALEVEVMLAPLRARDGRAELTLGALTWTAETPRLREGVRRLAIQGVTAAGDARRPRLGLAALDGRRLA